MLSDEESRDIYLKRLNYLSSGDFKYIDDIVTNHVPKVWDEVSVIYGAEYKKLLDMLPENRGFVLYGAGFDGARWLSFAKEDRRFVGFCSRTKRKQQNGYLGYPVMSPETLLSRKDLSVIVSTINDKLEIMQILKDGGYPQDLIFDGFMFGDGINVDPNQYFDAEFMTFEDKEVFVDAGCYDLSTSLNLRDRCKHLKVYAFEPDPAGFERCQKRKEQENFVDVEIFPFGTWSEKKSLDFDIMDGGESHIVNLGTSHPDNVDCSVPVVPIDEVIAAGDKITLIKMDVEGAELESLKGARRTIQRDKPKLAICIYHKPEDMWELPVYIKELVPEYKLYVRHHSTREVETVLYAIMP